MTTNNHVLIIGTGFSGICMGIRLLQEGIDDFTIVEQADEVGGTWRDNHYPGAACDVPSLLYSFSFEPNPGWSRAFAQQAEILAYLQRCVDKYGLRPFIRFRTAVTGARFDESSGLWQVQTSTGQTIAARVVVSGGGGLTRPAYPDIPGLSSFTGATFHSARWDHDYPLAGKSVAVIGTGASAIQVIPAIAPQVGKLQIYQRTPSWIIPRPDRAITPREQALYRRFPAVQQLVRGSIYARLEVMGIPFVVDPDIMRFAERWALRHLRRSVADPALRAKLTPRYRMGCKRILLSNDFYPAVQQEHVEVITDGIKEIRERSIVTVDGTERQVDALVLCTGFQVADVMVPYALAGRGGQDLNDVWREGAQAYLGSTVAGFPNLFFIFGPNTGLGHNSMIYMIESQVQYALRSIQAMRKGLLQQVEVRKDVQARYNERIQQRLRRTVWASGCNSWYQTKTGKNTTLWPGFTFEFRLRTRRFDRASYQTVQQAP